MFLTSRVGVRSDAERPEFINARGFAWCVARRWAVYGEAFRRVVSWRIFSSAHGRFLETVVEFDEAVARPAAEAPEIVDAKAQAKFYEIMPEMTRALGLAPETTDNPEA